MFLPEQDKENVRTVAVLAIGRCVTTREATLLRRGAVELASAVVWVVAARTARPAHELAP